MKMADADVLALRDQLYDLAGVAITMAMRVGKCEADVLDFMEADERVDVEERAAMLEFDAKMSRKEATRAALALRSGSRRTRR